MVINSEKSYEQYFQSLSNAHKSINQFRFGDMEDVNTDQRTAMASGHTMWLDYYQPITVLNDHDSLVGTLIADFTVMHPITKAENRAARQEIYMQCEDIVQQIFARIARDTQANTLKNTVLWQNTRFGRMEDWQFGATMYTGCAAELHFQVPLKGTYNENHWQT